MDDFADQCLACPLWNPFEIAPETCDIHDDPTLDEFEENLKFVALLLNYAMLVVPNLPLFLAISRRIAKRPEEDRKVCSNFLKALEEPVHECPICLSPQAEFPVVTDCGHVFCCECIIRWWLTNNGPFGVGTCGYCRQMFTKLIPIQWSTDPEDPEIKRNMDVYNKRFDPNRSFIDYLRDFPAFLRYYLRDPTGELPESREEFRIWLRHNFAWFSIWIFLFFATSFTFFLENPHTRDGN